MSDDLVFYANPMSRARIVRWMLEEVGQPYRTEILEFGTTIRSPDYLAINPMGKVPAIKHGDTVVTEAAAICAYLADVFPQAGLAPPSGDRRRGPYYRWLFFGAGPVEASTTNKHFGFDAPEGRESTLGYGSYARVMNALDQALSHSDYIAGDRFTAADVYAGSQVGWGMMFGSVEKRPAFERYWQRISARPAAERARSIDDALIAEMKARTPPK